MKIKQVKVVNQAREMINSKEMVKKYRTRKQYFTRDRIFTLPKLAALVIRGHKLPMQNAVNKFFRELGEVNNIPTSSAYSQARRKFKGELFQEINHGVTDVFYEHDEDYEKDIKLWKGKRILAADCTIINLPDKKELRKKYSVHTNQYQPVRVQAQVSLLYDLLNDIAINSWLDKKKSEKSYLFENHEKYIKEDDITVLDESYCDYSVLAEFISKKRFFVIRAPLLGTFKQVVEFAKSQKRDEIISIEVTQLQRDFVKKNNLPKRIEVRLLKVSIGESKEEMLITNLFDDEYTLKDFKELYGKRWNEETYFNRLKNLFEVEKFNGEDDIIIRQDFFGIIFLSTLESILSKGADEELKEESKELKYSYQVNRSVSISTMLDYMVDLLVSKTKTSEEVIDELSVFLKHNPCLQRSDRQYPRHTAKNYFGPYNLLYFYKYKKKIIA